MNILVTGGASGLGLSITRLLASDKKNKVHFTYCKSTEQARILMSENENVNGIFCDFTKSESLENLVAYIGSIHLDVLINNAYVGPLMTKRFTDVSPKNWLEGFSNNILPTLQITQSVISKFKVQKSGKIITILSSVVLGIPPIGWSQYCSEKSYLNAMCKSWASENITYNITSNAVSPSYMKTGIHGEQDERILEILKNQHPLKSLLSTDETASIIAFLVNCTQQMNGVNIPVQASLAV